METVESPTTAIVPSNASVSPLGDAKIKTKDKQRAAERASRQRRRVKLEAMRNKVQLLEQLALVVRVAPDADAVWDEFLDEDTKLARATLRRLVPVTAEIKKLLDEQARVQRLLAEHELARKAAWDLMESLKEPDEWETNTWRWRALARLYFRPLDTDQCARQIDAALRAMDKFMCSSDRETTGLTFMGWRDSRRLDAPSSSLQFSLDKIYRDYDMDHHTSMFWRVYIESELYSKIILGGRARVSVEVLQQISPTICVVRFAESYDDLPVTVHELYLFFRIDTEDSVILFLQSIYDRDLQDVINEPTDLWTSNYFWVKWDVLDATKPSSSTDYRLSAGGSLQGDDPAFLNRWLFEVLATMVRSDAVVTGRPTLLFS